MNSGQRRGEDAHCILSILRNQGFLHICQGIIWQMNHPQMNLWVSSSVLADRTAPLHLSEASFLKTKQESASPSPPPPNGGGPRRGFLRMECKNGNLFLCKPSVFPPPVIAPATYVESRCRLIGCPGLSQEPLCLSMAAFGTFYGHRREGADVLLVYLEHLFLAGSGNDLALSVRFYLEAAVRISTHHDPGLVLAGEHKGSTLGAEHNHK